jgi:glycosyltransferase involved in cell wall biosynthesis
VRKVLLVIPSLGYNGTSKQLLLLAAGLPQHRFEVRIAVLGESGCHAETLRNQGIEVYELGWKRLLDLTLFPRLRQLLAAYRPDVIHAWHLLSLRVLASAAGRGASRLIASAATQGTPWRPLWQQLDCRLLRRADLIIASGAAEWEHYRQQQIPEEKIVAVPPGVATRAVAGARDSLCRSLGIKQDARLVFCAGPLLPEKGFQDAIWSFAILHYLFEDLHLIVIGSGPERARLQQFVRASGTERRVHFLGDQPDAAAFFGHGEVVWVPSRRHGGVNVALEAMAAGRPVIASRLPALAEIIADGETGFLIEPGDKMALARKTRLLLDEPSRGRQLGEAGRQRIERGLTAAQLVDRFAHLYEEVIRNRGNR